MWRKASKSACALLSVVLILTATTNSFAMNSSDISSTVNDAAAYIVKTVSSPQVGSIGGEWAVLGLARSGCQINESYYKAYCAAVEAYVKACGGVPSDKKYTEYSRLIIALTAIGKDPSNVAGYNLLTPLGDYDKTVWQGINGPIFALIALDSGSYPIPSNPDAKKQATRELYIENILSRQLSNGGFAMSGSDADPDITAMALQALSNYQNRTDVNLAIDRALNCISALQDNSGGFSYGGSTFSESVSQTIVALCELGISPEDSRFVKNGVTLVDNLMKYYIKGGGFKHLTGSNSADEMSTEQAFYAIISVLRLNKGENSLYDMGDAITVTDGAALDVGEGLIGKNADVKTCAILNPGKTFSDISEPVADKCKAAIEALSSRGIISGYDDGTFRPNKTMTRAEFAAIVVRALGLSPQSKNTFFDVAASSWYAPYVGTANEYGIVKGKSASTFDPFGTITRQEAAVMTARAAKLCGMDTFVTVSGIRDILAAFCDYPTVAVWAQESVAFCCRENISDTSELELRPNAAITRGEIAQMLSNMLLKSNLLKGVAA